MAITLILPSGITFAEQSPTSEYTVHFGSGNGGIGGTVPIVVDDATSFNQGVDARVTWTEDGSHYSRTFHFAVSEGDVSRGGP